MKIALLIFIDKMQIIANSLMNLIFENKRIN